MNFTLIGVLVILMILGYVLYGILAFLMKFKHRANLLPKLVWIAFVFSIGATGFFAFRIFSPISSELKGEVFFVIRKGMNARSVANLLHDRDLIRNKREFSIVSSWFNLDRSLKAGRYKIIRGTSLVKIVQMLAGGNFSVDLVTIPEGLTIPQTASRLVKSGIDSIGFVRAAQDRRFARELGLEVRDLEGYLFPDTYQFAWGCSPRVVIKTMASRFMENYNLLASKDALLKTQDQQRIVILASIIEKESGVNSERPRIAGVFWNRVRKGMMIGADPTVRYALKKFTGSLTVSDLNVNSPYNTRKFRGLPPGPICSPGLKSIEAAMFPLDTPDLFFVAKGDGSGEHIFSRTLLGHARAKQRVRKAAGSRN